MTKYILHGGRAGKQSLENKNFFIEMVNGLPDKASVLCVLFAREKDVWNIKFEEDKKIFLQLRHKKFLILCCQTIK